MSKKKKIVPELRFPEFVNGADWKPVRIEELIEQHIEKSDYSNQYPVLTSSRDGIMFQREYYNNRDVASLDNTGYNVVPRGYFTYRHMSDDLVFKFNINTICDRGIVSTLYPVFSAKDTKVIPFFLQTVLNEGQEFKNFAISQKQGGSRTYMYLSKLKELQITIPGVLEQRKIATCFSSLVETIAAHSQKLELLKEHKKGLMQNLFPQGGEKVPKYRFKEFAKDGDWKKMTLGEISKITSGGTPNRSENQYWNGDIPWITTTLIDFNIINEANEYITEVGLQNSSAKIFPKGTILMAMYGQGKTRGKVGVLGIDAATNQACAAILLKKEYSTDYVFQYLAAHYDEIRELSNKGGQENLSGGLIENIRLSIPNLAEQQKIASCLSSLDGLITAQTEKIEQLKQHKKGMMQGLFPKMND